MTSHIPNHPDDGLNRWGRLFALAASHHGVVTHAMAAEVGLSRQAVRDRARVEGWVQVTRGVWLVPGAEDDLRARACAHLLLFGPRAVLSHDTAAHLHGLVADAPARPQLLVPNDRNCPARPGAEVRRTRTLVQGDVEVVQGLRVTIVARTLRDLAPRRTWSQLYDLVTDAEQRRLVETGDLVAIAERLAHGRGAGRFRSVVTTREQDRSDSALERDTRLRAREAGFAPSDGPFPIRTRGGRLLRLDVAFAAAWFAIECDGYGFHTNRPAFERDRQRWRLAQQAGWRLTWVTRRRLRDDLPGIIEEIADAHRTADPTRPAAVPAV